MVFCYKQSKLRQNLSGNLECCHYPMFSRPSTYFFRLWRLRNIIITTKITKLLHLVPFLQVAKVTCKIHNLSLPSIKSLFQFFTWPSLYLPFIFGLILFPPAFISVETVFLSEVIGVSGKQDETHTKKLEQTPSPCLYPPTTALASELKWSKPVLFAYKIFVFQLGD